MTMSVESQAGSDIRRRGFPWATILLWLSAIIVAFPFVWMLRSALMPAKYIMRFPPIWIPPEVTLNNFVKLLTLQPFAHYIGNSLLVAVIVTIGQVTIASLSGYAFARLRFPGRDRLFLLYLATMIVPTQVTLIPQYVLISWLGWVDTYAALTVPLLANAFLTFLMRQFFLSIPRELEDAAKMDGAGYFRTFATIIMPLAAPAVATSALLAFITNWTNYLWPLIVTRTRDMRTVPVGLAAFQDETAGNADFGQIMAGSVLSMLPMFILFVLLQRYVVRSVATTGVKG